MKTKTLNTLAKVKELRESYEMEEFYKTWLTLSWVFLIIGYAILVVNYTLFIDDPQLLYGLGLFMLSVSLVNLFLMTINIVFLLALIFKEEGWFYYREYFWISFGYIIVSLLLWKASIVG